MRYSEEDFERAIDLDKLWLLDKEAEMFVEFQQWEDEHERLPAEIVVMTPISKLNEI